MRFVAVDVETANANMASICQIGLVRFENGVETASDSFLIDPQTWFDSINVSIHGIDEARVRGAPTLPDLHERLSRWTANEIVVCHTHFDRVALSQACDQHRLAWLTCRWLDSARVSRRAWAQFATSGYGLANVARYLDIAFQHHDALHDARAAGTILLRAIEQTGHDLESWFKRVEQPLSGITSIKQSGRGEGSLAGETIAFTGALVMPRARAAILAADAGANVDPSVTRKTTLLIVGDQDIARLNGRAKSSKHLKAESLITAGQKIRILGETDFLAMISMI